MFIPSSLTSFPLSCLSPSISPLKISLHSLCPSLSLCLSLHIIPPSSPLLPPSLSISSLSFSSTNFIPSLRLSSHGPKGLNHSTGPSEPPPASPLRAPWQEWCAISQSAHTQAQVHTGCQLGRVCSSQCASPVNQDHRVELRRADADWHREEWGVCLCAWRCAFRWFVFIAL